MLRLFLYALVFLGVLTAQSQWTNQVFVDGHFFKKQTFRDSIGRAGWIHQRLVSFWDKGYLYAELDSISANRVYIHQGEKLQQEISAVKVFDADSGVYKAIQVKSPLRFLNSLTRNGYPFACLQVDSVLVENDKYSAIYYLDPGPLIRYDSLYLLSKVNVNRSFLQNALNMKKGDLYSEQTFQEIPDNIERIPFLQLKQTADLAFENGGATIYLDLLQEPSSSFEGVIGFLPGQSANNKLVVTGYLDLQLANLFQSGIGLDLTWNRFADQSQELNLGYYHPYFLSSRLFADLQLDILKQDTTYLTRSWKLGLGTFLSRTIALQLTYQNEAASLISADVQDLENGFADYQTNDYSLSLGHSQFDAALGFGRKSRFRVGASLGDKELKKNSNLDDETYDSLRTNSLRVILNGAFKYQLPFLSRSAFYHEVKSGFIFNDQILNNEVSRLGGLRSVRGFNENFFFAQHHILSRMEVRQYFERRSFFMLFYDQLFYARSNVWDWPTGFGMGLNLNTSNGLFTFAMAVGKAEDISLDFSNVKVHLGYTTKF